MAICAVLQAAKQMGITSETFRTEDVGRTVHLPSNGLKKFSHEALGRLEKPKYWTTGISESAAVAVHTYQKS